MAGLVEALLGLACAAAGHEKWAGICLSPDARGILSHPRRMVDTIELLTVDDKVSGPGGTVYSTGVRTAIGADGKKYFVKGPEPETVFAELAGCLLASEVGLQVPRVAVCRFGGEVFCGSEDAATLGRNIEPWLAKPERIRNFGALYSAVVVDIWLANTDRNMGNALVRSVDGQYEFVMIDFEKSVVLHPSPTIKSTMVEAAQLWPTEDFGRRLRQLKPAGPPTAVIGKIQAFAADRAAVTGVLGSVTAAYQPVEWCNDCLETLVSRGTKIQTLAREVWDLQ